MKDRYAAGRAAPAMAHDITAVASGAAFAAFMQVLIAARQQVLIVPNRFCSIRGGASWRGTPTDLRLQSFQVS